VNYDKEKVDEIVLALLYLTTFNDDYGFRAWKGMNWDAMDRLHEKVYIGRPKGKAKSVALSDEGVKLSEQLFKKHFGLSDTKV